MKNEISAGFYLEGWKVEPPQLLLSSPDNTPITLQPRTMAVLVCLAENAGQIVSRQTFSERIWAPAVVSDDALNRCIADLRRQLGDSRSPPRYIETVPKRGYRLVAAVRSLDENMQESPSSKARNNLPAQRSSFIGREKEISRLIQLIHEVRLVTLTGVGGVGKTRLALIIAEHSLARGHFSDGVFFVDLSPLNDETLIPQGIAEAMNLPPDKSSLSALKHSLQQRDVLLIIDNCEHLIDAAAGLIDELLTYCPQLTVLATSREALNLEGETIDRVPSLTLPAEGQPAVQSEAVRLFAERAKAVSGDFALNEVNEKAVVEICQRLDGIPLAIELAAARTSHLSVDDITERLDNRFHLLTGDRRRRAQRQQTLQAAVDWSFDLLTPEEQTLLTRLSVFSGTFSLEAVEGICMDGIPDYHSVDLLANLVSKSLLLAYERDGSMRYRLLETIRLYAMDRLVATNEADKIRHRHCDWFIDLTKQYSLDELFISSAVHNTLWADIDNFRLAIDWAESNRLWDKAIGLTVALGGVWAWVTNPKEGCRRIYRLYQSADLSIQTKTQCRALLAFPALFNCDWDTLIEAIFSDDEVDEELEHSTLILLCQGLYLTYSSKHHQQALSQFSDTIAATKKHRQPRLEEFAKTMLVHCYVRIGNPDNAIELGESVNPSELVCEAFLRIGLSTAYLQAGNLDGVRSQALRLKAFNGSGTGLVHSYRPFWESMLDARSAVLSSDYSLANDLLIRASKAYFENPYPLMETDCVSEFAALCIAEKDFERAHYLLNSIRHQFRATYPFRLPASQASFQYYECKLAEVGLPEKNATLEEYDQPVSIEEALRSELNRRKAGTI